LLPFQMFGWRPPLLSDAPEIGYDEAGIAALKAAGQLGPR
jgi:hypothetical protein